MDLEQLTKHQIVLLTLLVSFVTSIATGIVTVSLMSQAPPSVTRTINQIVERTVQTVAAPVAATAVAPSVVTQKTVVVKSDDLAAQSIAAVQKAIIRITLKGGNKLLARGVIIDEKGTALTDAAALESADAGTSGFDAILSDGERVPVGIPKGQGTTSPILIIDLAMGTSTGFAPASVADSSKLQLGQSVILVGGVGVDMVDEGVIAALPESSGDIEASVAASTPGSIIISLFGEIIGMATALGDKTTTHYTLVPIQNTTGSTTTSTNATH